MDESVRHAFSHLTPASRLTLPRCAQSPLFTVEVGQEPNKKTFYIHEKVLADCSLYFACLLRPTSSFIESQERRVHLNDEVDTPEAFEVILEYTYSSAAYKSDSGSEYRVPGDKHFSVAFEVVGQRVEGITLLSKVFVMAERLLMTHLQMKVAPDSRNKLSNVGMYMDNGMLEEVCDLVDNIHTSTTLHYGRDPDPPTFGRVDGIVRNDKRTQGGKLSSFLAHFCAAQLSSLIVMEDFMELTDKHPDFWLAVTAEMSRPGYNNASGIWTPRV